MSANIHNIRNYAECASASYALFNIDDFIKLYDLKDSSYFIKKLGFNTLDEFKIYMSKDDTYKLALDIRFRGISVTEIDDSINQLINPKNNMLDNYLNQTKNFLSKNIIKAHKCNLDKGFSATLFYNSADNEYILAMHGIDGFFVDMHDFYKDENDAFDLFLGQYIEMLLFYEHEVKPYIQTQRLIVVGNSLGGVLAQYFTLSFHNNTNNIVYETYTFNSPGVKKSIRSKLLNILKENFLSRFKVKHNFTIKNTNRQIEVGYSSLDIIEYIKNSPYLAVYINQMIANIDDLSNINTQNYVYHVESCIGISSTKQWFEDDAAQHLWTDINGTYLFINNNMLPFSTKNNIGYVLFYDIEHMISTLYFYEFIMENEKNIIYYDTEDVCKTFNQLNEYTSNCHFTYKLRKNIRQIYDIHSVYLSYLYDMCTQTEKNSYNQPIAEILEDIYLMAGLDYQTNINNSKLISNYYKIIDAILFLKNENISLKQIQPDDLEPDKLSSIIDKFVLYYIYPYLLYNNNEKISKILNEHFSSSNFLSNLDDNEYLNILHYLYSNIYQAINEINNNILSILKSDKAKKYDDYTDLIKTLKKEKEKKDAKEMKEREKAKEEKKKKEKEKEKLEAKNGTISNNEVKSEEISKDKVEVKENIIKENKSNDNEFIYICK